MVLALLMWNTQSHTLFFKYLQIKYEWDIELIILIEYASNDNIDKNLNKVLWTSIMTAERTY